MVPSSTHPSVPMRRVPLALLVALLAACASAPPAPPPAPAPPLADPEPPAEPALDPSTAELAESARASVRATTIWVASGVDSWFGDRRFAREGRVTNGQLDVSLLKRERERWDADVRLNARFTLPNIERLGYVFVGRDNERELVTDRPGALTRQDQLQPMSAEDKKFFVGLGRALDEAFDVRLGLRGAFKPYAQARLRARWELGAADVLEARQTFFWTVDDRAGSTTAVSWDHVLTPSLGLRWLAAATVTQELPKFVWASSIGAYQGFGHQRQLSLEALVNGQQGSGVGALDYGLQARWEQPVHQDWLLGNVVLGHFWPRPMQQEPRRGAWALGAGLKMRF
jgi:hypothetical protein